MYINYYNKYSFYITILFSIFIILIIIYFYKNILKLRYENFDNQDCTPGTPCSTIDGFGILNSGCQCQISNYPYNSEINNDYSDTNNVYDETLSESEENINCSDTLYGCCPSDETITKIDSLGSNCPDCINPRNFDQYCKNINPKYGVKKLQKCGENKFRVSCDADYIGGIKYGENLVITPCLDKNIDFNTMCQYYNNKKIPKGYNINSIAAGTILKGIFGDCYNSNGIPDNNKARAICSNNYYNTVKKLSPSSLNSNMNFFTNCSPIDSNFTEICQQKFNNDNIFSTEIMGYDCLPGYARAKCFKNINNDNNNFNVNKLLQNIYSS